MESGARDGIIVRGDRWMTLERITLALALLVPFPVVVWGSDELRRWLVRRRD